MHPINKQTVIYKEKFYDFETYIKCFIVTDVIMFSILLFYNDKLVVFINNISYCLLQMHYTNGLTKTQLATDLVFPEVSILETTHNFIRITILDLLILKSLHSLNKPTLGHPIIQRIQMDGTKGNKTKPPILEYFAV